MNVEHKDILDGRILIIEDDYLGRAVLREVFRKQGFRHVEEAENGKQGLEKIEDFKPDLIILDVMMPEMDGAECCRRIRKNPNRLVAGVPVLFQTSLDGIADKARLFEAGGTDYLTKPVDPHEITSRALVHLEREVMNRLLREYNARVMQELETARATQRVLIPDEVSTSEMEKDYKLHIHGHYHPCSELGGDFWGFKSISSEELAVYMADFSGHGVGAALNVFRLHALMQASMDTAPTPGAYLSHLNAVLTPLLPAGQFATMFYGIINSKKNQLAYASAAAPDALLFRGDEARCQLLKSTGTLLGAFCESSYQTVRLPFSPGDCLLLYSDALIETEDEKGKVLDAQSIANIFQIKLQQKSRPAKTALSSLLEYFNTHHAPRLSDDLTLSAYYRVE